MSASQWFYDSHELTLRQVCVCDGDAVPRRPTCRVTIGNIAARCTSHHWNRGNGRLALLRRRSCLRTVPFQFPIQSAPIESQHLRCSRLVPAHQRQHPQDISPLQLRSGPHRASRSAPRACSPWPRARQAPSFRRLRRRGRLPARGQGSNFVPAINSPCLSLCETRLIRSGNLEVDQPLEFLSIPFEILRDGDCEIIHMT